MEQMNNEMKIHWHAEHRRVSQLKEIEDNPRRITEAAFRKLVERIRERGFHDVLKIDLHDNILSGNMRKKALMAMGIQDVDVMVPDRELTKDERDKIVLESNRNDGEWDWELLGNFDAPILLDAGFSEDEMRINFGLVDADEVEVDYERFGVLAVLPPESPRLKERVAVRFSTKEDYDKVKRFLMENGSDDVAKIMLEMASS